ncbi:MAG: helix-turn-helix domain-containing protein [Steroidobacteraceae bacterium]
MARAVPPWLWAVMIRDHGPRDATLRLCLLTLRTFMDSNGSAFPSQATLAKAACVAEFTVQKKLKRASELQWLGIQVAGHTGKGWKHYRYVACIPDDIGVPDKHERLAEKWSEIGDVSTLENGHMVPTQDGDDMATRRASSPSSRNMVPILSSEGPHPHVNIVPIQDGTKSSFLSSQYKFSREGALRTPIPFPIKNKEEAVPMPEALREQIHAHKTKTNEERQSLDLQSRLSKAKKFVQVDPGTSDAVRQRMYQLDPDQIQEVRQAAL